MLGAVVVVKGAHLWGTVAWQQCASQDRSSSLARYTCPHRQRSIPDWGTLQPGRFGQPGVREHKAREGDPMVRAWAPALHNQAASASSRVRGHNKNNPAFAGSCFVVCRTAGCGRPRTSPALVQHQRPPESPLHTSLGLGGHGHRLPRHKSLVHFYLTARLQVVRSADSPAPLEKEERHPRCGRFLRANFVLTLNLPGNKPHRILQKQHSSPKHLQNSDCIEGFVGKD